MLSRKVALLILLAATLASACNTGCAQCDSASGVCFACTDNYELTLLGECVPASIPYCMLYLNSSQCLQCIPTRQLLNNSCQPDLSGCLQNISATRCARCFPTLTNLNGTCVGVLNCKQTYNSNGCAVCETGFTLQNQVCSANTQNCLTVSPQLGVCLQCADGYSMVGLQCIANNLTSANCYLYDSTAKCYLCKTGYSIAGNNCALQNSQGLIQTSPPQTTPNNNNSSPDTNSNHITQITSAPAANNTTAPTATPSTTTTTPPGTAPTTATTPAATFTPTLPPTSYNNFIFCSQIVNQTCTACYVTFYLTNGSCRPVSSLCQAFNYTTSRCDGCYGGYILNSAFDCVVATSSNYDPNCKTFINATCTDCYPQFFLNNTRCQPRNPLCKSSNTNGSCQTCYDGYAISGSTCVLATSTTSSTSTTTNTSSSNGTKDSMCIILSGSQCQTCVNGYYPDPSSGRCVPLSLNCLAHNMQTGDCTQCLPQLILINNNCIVPVNKCIQYYGNATCANCDTGYYLKGTLCFPKDVTCAAYDPQGNCQTCLVTYYLINGVCVFPALGFDPLCSTYVNSYCTACSPGSYLSNYRCVSIDINCTRFDPASSLCTACANSLTPLGPNCV